MNISIAVNILLQQIFSWRNVYITRNTSKFIFHSFPAIIDGGECSINRHPFHRTATTVSPETSSAASILTQG